MILSDGSYEEGVTASIRRRDPSARLVWKREDEARIGAGADAFFAFFVLGGRFMSVHRRFNLDLPSEAFQPTRYSSLIVLTEYDRVGSEICARREHVLCPGEDPRVVSDGVRAWVLCRSAWDEFPDAPESYKMIVLPEGLERRVEMPPGVRVGKNWQPFLKDGDLFAVHGFDPLTVLAISANGRATVAHETRTELNMPAFHDGYTMVRGGSNAVVSDNVIFGLGHLTVRRHDHRPFLWVLDEAMRMNLIVPAVFFGLREKGFNILDPTSLFVCDGRIHLGVCASEREWFYGQRFLNILIELPFSNIDAVFASSQGATFSHLGCDHLNTIRPSRVYLPTDLPRQVPAQETQDGLISQGQAGCLVHGPYELVKYAGEHVASLTYACRTPPPSAKVGQFDVSFFKEGKVTTVAKGALTATGHGTKNVRLSFSSAGHVGALLETRVFVEQNADVEVLDIRITSI